MASMIMIATALAATPTSAGSCQRIHIFADGRVERTRVPDEGQGASAAAASASASPGPGHASSHVSSHASSHVSASSSSSEAGGSSRSSASSMADGVSRAVTVTRGPDGCRILIDERPDRSNP
ncbi:MAG TPA: hypothetical protein VJQ78_07935 [Sphingobium sp.]|nr:hypothetical protein [Sphingobium sp.]